METFRPLDTIDVGGAKVVRDRGTTSGEVLVDKLPGGTPANVLSHSDTIVMGEVRVDDDANPIPTGQDDVVAVVVWANGDFTSRIERPP